MQKVEDLLDASAYWLTDYLCIAGLGISIPPYQRPYTWEEKGHLEPLLADICRNIDFLRAADDRSVFMGTIITIEDERLRQHLVQLGGGSPNIPTRIHTVVDGQQRLTTMILLTTALHHRLSAINLATNTGALPWLTTQVEDTLEVLAGTFRFWAGPMKPEYTPLPRMTREMDDVWSRNLPSARYESPIAALLADYSDYLTKGNRVSPFDPTASMPVGDFDHLHQAIRARWLFFDRMASSGSFGGSGARLDYLDDFPSTESLLEADPLQRALYEEPIDASTRAALKASPEFRRLFGLDVFARFVCRRISTGVISTRNEDAAFDMFEALNTTGELLTAVETLKPQVVLHTPDFPNSRERKVLDEISDWLGGFKQNDRRQAESARLVVSAILAQTGGKCGNHLSEQRSRLSEAYRAVRDAGASFELVETLGDVEAYTADLWSSDPAVAIGTTKLPDRTRFATRVLFDANHEITKAPLSRYYADARKDPARAVASLDEAAAAVVAFFALWRGFFGGTSGIDAVYRSWMAEHGSRRYEPTAGSGLLARDTPAPDDLRNYLRNALAAKGIDRASFVKAASETPVYRSSRPLARFLLLAAMHDSVVDPANPGQVMAGKSNVSPQLVFARWVDRGAFSVEHIAPQQATSSWDSDLYKDPDVVHCLGNLILLPGDLNSSLGASAPEVKSLAFRLLGAQTVAEADAVKHEAALAGVLLPPGIKASAAYHVLAASVSGWHQPWDRVAVETRSKVLAGRAWDNLRPWLG